MARYAGLCLAQSSLFALPQYASCEIGAVHFPTFVLRWGVPVTRDAFAGYSGKVLLTVLLQNDNICIHFVKYSTCANGKTSNV